MDFSVANGLNDQVVLLRQARAAARPQGYQPALKPQENAPAHTQELAPSNTNTPQGTRLLQETRDDLGGGAYRLTKTFEREDGRAFTRIEEFALTKRGSRKSIIQQNPSGSVTQYEEVLEREPGGNFRRTQRFKDASGEVSTNITTGYKVTDPYILMSGAALPAYGSPSPFGSFRGTQLDLHA
ncbi:MAG TPA: hypothetical protein VFS88_01770 [Micavibrio sp.]|nr:hypothetical protein [Micavibrio sp.]